MSHKRTILAIAAKSKRLGIAVYSGKYLIYYESKSLISNRNSSIKIAEKTIESLIHTFKPKCLAIEKLIYQQQQKRPVITISQKITDTAVICGIPVRQYSPNAVRGAFTNDLRPNQEKMARSLVLLYPELTKFLRFQNRWQYIYSMVIFNAVALGLHCVTDLHKTENEYLQSKST